VLDISRLENDDGTIVLLIKIQHTKKSILEALFEFATIVYSY